MVFRKTKLDCFTRDTQGCVPIDAVQQSQWSDYLAGQSAWGQHWLFSLKPAREKHHAYLMPDEKTGQLAKVIYMIPEHPNLWDFAPLYKQLPLGHYIWSEKYVDDAVLAWALAAYVFNKQFQGPKLWLESFDFSMYQQASAIYWIRDLINAPPNLMGPDDLACQAQQLSEWGAEVTVLQGDELLKQHYPAVHAVGRSSERAPCVIDVRWGDARLPKLVLVGKGVCFDTGGLDLKSPVNMKLMKKDMGGAAHVLGLAQLIMQAQLPVQLRVLIPAADNAVDGRAFRPSDVIATKSGLSVEIGNTDAEGRLLLADALTEAVQAKPDLVVDFATLTGAARVALGPSMPALFSNFDLHSLLECAVEKSDPLWQLPLHQPYEKYIQSDVAKLNNSPSLDLGGAIHAALFLQHFVDSLPWIHVDLMAWNLSSEPGRPQGGEAMGIRAVFTWLKAWSQAQAST